MKNRINLLFGIFIMLVMASAMLWTLEYYILAGLCYALSWYLFLKPLQTLGSAKI